MELLKVLFWNEKLFSFPNLSACPTDATSDGTSDCKCAENFQFNDDKTACVGKFQRILK